MKCVITQLSSFLGSETPLSERSGRSLHSGICRLPQSRCRCLAVSIPVHGLRQFIHQCLCYDELFHFPNPVSSFLSCLMTRKHITLRGNLSLKTLDPSYPTYQFHLLADFLLRSQSKHSCLNSDCNHSAAVTEYSKSSRLGQSEYG